jgi:hypothetical protein
MKSIKRCAYRRLVELVDVRRGIQHPLEGRDKLGNHNITTGGGSGSGVVSEGADGLGSTDGCPANYATIVHLNNIFNLPAVRL